MASYLRPRRGKKSTAIDQAIILKRGELFMEAPDAGVGKGPGRIKVGDGTTVYGSLPYFYDPDDFGGDVSTSAVEFTETTDTNNNTILGRIVSGATVATIVAATKNLFSNLNTFVGTSTDWGLLSTAQKTMYAEAHFTDDYTPGGGGSDNKLFSIQGQTLSFSNKVATISNARVNSGTYTLVYYSDATLEAAKAADITVTTGIGVITFTAANTPTGTITCDIVCIDMSAQGVPTGTVTLNATLSAGNTSVDFMDSSITSDSVFDVYVPIEYSQLTYSSIAIVASNTVRVTFPKAESEDIVVKLKVTNIT